MSKKLRIWLIGILSAIAVIAVAAIGVFFGLTNYTAHASEVDIVVEQTLTGSTQRKFYMYFKGDQETKTAAFIGTSDAEGNDVTFEDKSLEIPEEVTYENDTYTITTIGNGEELLDINVRGVVGTTIIFPSTITTIADYAFYGENYFAKIEFSSEANIEFIGKYAFFNSTFSTFFYGNKLTEIGDYAFASTGISSVTLPDSVKVIGKYAFNSCSLMVSFTISENSKLEELGEYAFYNCKALEEIYIPQNVVSIEKYTFADCVALSSVGGMSSVTTIGNFAFKNTKQSSIVIPDSVISIGESAYYNDFSNQTVVIRSGESLKSVGNTAFYFLKAKVYFDIKFYYSQTENGTTSICTFGDSVFNSSAEVYLIKSPNLSQSKILNWQNIRGLALSGEWVTDIDSAEWLISSVEVLDAKTINNTTYGTDGNNVTYILTEDGDTNTAKLDSISDVGSFVNLVIPATVMTTSGKIYSVTSFTAGMFQGATSLESIVIPSTLTDTSSLVGGCFNGCSNLEYIYVEANIILDENITSGTDAALVYTCGVYADSTSSENLDKYGYYSNFILSDYYKDSQGIYYYIDYENRIAYVGDSCTGDDETSNTSKYNGSSYYSGTTGHAIIPDFVSIDGMYYKVTGIGRYAFYNCSTLRCIELGAFIQNNLTDANDDTESGLGDCAFRNCALLEKFTVDPKNEYFGSTGDILLAIKNGSYVQIVVAGKRVTEYSESYLGDYIDSLKVNLHLSDTETLSACDVFGSINSVNLYAFANCTSLSSFDFSNISHIGTHAFDNTSLEEVVLGETNQVAVGEYAFANNNLLETVKLGKKVSLERFVFLYSSNIMMYYSNSTEFIAAGTVVSSDADAQSSYATYGNTLYQIVAGSASSDYAVLLQYGAGTEDETAITINDIEYNNTTYAVREIEAYAFYNANITSVDIGDEVYIIGKAAFENCSRLTEVYIGKNVKVIGLAIYKRACDDANGYDIVSYLVKNNISGTITTLMYNGSSDYPVEVYEQEVFNGCTVLSYLNVDSANVNYLTDTNGVLYSADKATLILYAQGITRVSYTVSASVTKIAMEAFQNNVHLQRLIINEKVTEIGAKAFNGCTKLEWIYFRSLTAPIIGEQVFNSTGALGNNGTLVLYCIYDDYNIWLADNALLWSNYASSIKQYNAIQNVENQETTADDVYRFFVVDSDGNYLPGMQVTITYIDSSGNNVSVIKIVSESGYATLVLTDEILLNTSLCIEINDPDERYYSYSAEEFYIDTLTYYSYVTMISTAQISPLYCNTTNISEGTYTLNTEYYDDETVDFTGYVYWDPVYTPDEISIYQLGYSDGSVLWELTFEISDDKNSAISAAYYTVNGTTTAIDIDSEIYAYGSLAVYEGDRASYEFYIPIEWFSGDDYDRIYVSVRYSESYSYYNLENMTIELRVNIFDRDLDSEVEYSFLSTNVTKYDITFDSDIPILGDATFSVDFTKFEMLDNDEPTLTYQVVDDKVVVLLNFGLYSNEKKEGYADYYDYVVRMISKANKEVLSDSTTTLKQFFEIELSGAVEFGVTSLRSDFTALRAYIEGSLTWKFQSGQTVFVYVVPVRIEVSINASFDLKISVMLGENYDSDKGFFDNVPIEMELQFKGTVYGGVGWSIASVGVYGSLNFDMIVTLTSSLGKLEGTITADFGLYLKLNLGIIKYSQKWSVFDLTGISKPTYKFNFTLYGENTTAVTYNLTASDGSVLTFSSLRSAMEYSMFMVDNTFQACDYTEYSYYGGIYPTITTYNGTTYMFYIDNVLLNSAYRDVNGEFTDTTYNEYNYLKLVYCTLNNDGTWSTPVIVSDGLCNDVNYTLCTDDNGIHITYISTETMTADNVSEYKMAVNAISLMASGLIEAVNLSEYTENYILNIAIYSDNNIVYVSWQENTDGNVFGIGSIYETSDGDYVVNNTTANIVKAVSYTIGNSAINLTGSTINISGLGVITGMKFVEVDGSVYVLAIFDKDGDLSTAENEGDRYLIFIPMGTSSAEGLATILLADEDGDMILDASSVIYENGVLYVSGSASLYKIDLTTPDANGNYVATVVLSDVGTDITFVYNEGSLVGILYNVYSADDTSNLYFVAYANGQFGYAVQITDLGDLKAAESFSYYVDSEGKIQIVYVLSEKDDTVSASESENDDVRVNSIVTTELAKTPDLYISEISANAMNVEADTDFNIYITLTNDSLLTITGLTAQLYCDNALVCTYTDSEFVLLSGETATFTAIFNISTFGTDYYVIVSADEDNFANAEADVSNNKAEITLAYPDLSVDAKYVEIGDVKYLLVIVKNDGTADADGFTIIVENGISTTAYADIDTQNGSYLYTYSYVDTLSVGAYMYFTIELNKVYFTEEYVTVFAVIDEEDRNVQDNVTVLSYETNESVTTANTYYIYYYVNGVKVNEEAYSKYATIDSSYTTQNGAVAYAEKMGCDISGYSYSDSWVGEKYTSMPAHDIYFYCNFTVNYYTVTYMSGNTELYVDSFAYGADIIYRAETIQTGYTYTWCIDDNGSYILASDTYATMPAYNIVVYEVGTVCSYSISYYVDKDLYQVQTYLYGSEITVPDYQTKEGYTFSGWTGVPSTMPAYDLVFYATESINTYTLTYMVGETEIRYDTITYNTSVNLYSYQPHSGYTFEGWMDSAGTVVTSMIMPASNTTLYAILKAVNYKVYYYFDGELVNTATVAYGSVIPFYSYVIGTVSYSTWENLPDTMPATNVYVSGGTSVMTYYYVTYSVNDEVLYEDAYPENAEILKRSAEIKDGYTFEWGNFTDESGTLYEGSGMPTYNLYCIGTYIINSYNVNYYVNGEIVKVETIEYGSAITAYDYVPESGYTFSGFDGIPETMPAYDINVYGTTSISWYSISYYVDNILSAIEYLNYGDKVTAYPYIAETGYKFLGWNDLPETMPAENINIYGTTEKISYTLNYYVDDELVYTTQYYYKDEVQSYEYQAATGKMFTGFENEITVMPAQSVDVYGYTSNIIYTVVYTVYLNEEIYVEYEDFYLYGDKIVIRDDVVKEGYAFSGWSEIPGIMPAKDLSVSATLTINSYKVIYIIDGVVVYDEDYVYGENIVMYYPDDKDGYSFSGWDKSYTVMDAADLIAEGKYDANIYTVTYYIGDSVYKTLSYSYGSAIDLDGIELDGYSIVGWTLNDAQVMSITMPAGDIALKAIVADSEDGLTTLQLCLIVGGAVFASTAILSAGITVPIMVRLKKKRDGIITEHY